MRISKKLRAQIHDKYGGLCAYTGTPLDDDWQVDHITSKNYEHWLKSEQMRKYLKTECTDINDIANMVPSQRIINHYKRSKHLEDFRKYMLTFHIRLAKLPKKTRLVSTEKRIAYMWKVAGYFGITPDKPFDGVFYFEKQKEVSHETT